MAAGVLGCASFQVSWWRSTTTGTAGATPVDVIPNFLTNTWYVVRIVLDDARGFYLEVYQESAPAVRGSYQQWMPTGQAWRFRHWIYSGNAYLDDYREFGTGDLTWEPDERMNFSYDALNRLIATAPDSGASGYRHTYAYTANGNILSRTDVGSYAYPPAGQARPHAATAAGANSYGYDPNGNMTARTEKRRDLHPDLGRGEPAPDGNGGRADDDLLL